MSKYRFVDPNTVKLDLSDGDWIEIKEQLGYGEQQRLAGGAMTKMVGGPVTGGELADAGVEMDLEKYQLLRLKTWLVDWSFRDRQGKAVKINLASLSSLHPDAVEEINAALTVHIESLETAKNAPTPPTEKSE